MMERQIIKIKWLKWGRNCMEIKEIIYGSNRELSLEILG